MISLTAIRGNTYHRVNSGGKWVYWYCIGKSAAMWNATARIMQISNCGAYLQASLDRRNLTGANSKGR